MGLLESLGFHQQLIADEPVPPAAAASPSSFLLDPSSLPALPSDPPAAAAASSTAAPPATAGGKDEGERMKEEGGQAFLPATIAQRPAPKITLGLLVAAWIKGDTEASARVIRMGQMADAWLADQADHAVARPNAIRHLVDRLKTEGLRGESLRVSRIVAISWVGRLFGYSRAKTLPLSTLRALLPLIKRQPRSGKWQIRAMLKDRALALWVRIGAECLSAAAVRDEVTRLRPPRISSPSRSRPAMRSILRKLDAVTNPDDLALIGGRVREKMLALAHAGAQGRAA